MEAHRDNENLGTAVDVQYFHRDGTNETVRAFVSTEERRSEKTKERYDVTVFSQLSLSANPRINGDYIEYNSDTHIVDFFREQHGTFIVYCKTHRSQTGSRK